MRATVKREQHRSGCCSRVAAAPLSSKQVKIKLLNILFVREQRLTRQHDPVRSDAESGADTLCGDELLRCRWLWIVLQCRCGGQTEPGWGGNTHTHLFNAAPSL